jgi:hypothetical protein
MTAALLLIAALLAYGLFVLASPVVTCPRRRVIKRKGRRSRSVRCRRCKGKGLRYRRGARLVHALYWSVAGDAVKARFRERYEERISDAGHLEDD